MATGSTVVAEPKGEASNCDALSSPVCLFVYMYIRPSQPETPRLHNSLVFSAGPHDNKTLYLATIGHKTAQHSISSMLIVVNVAHCFSEGYTPVGHSAILADVICPTWPGTLSLFTRVKR